MASDGLLQHPPRPGLDQCPQLIQGVHQQQESLEVLQQLAEELRAKYMGGKGATAASARWAAVEPTTAAAAEPTTAAAAGTQRRGECRSERDVNRTKHRTLEMPHVRVR